MKALPKASHTGREGFWHGSTEMSRQDTSPSPTIRDAPWEHDQGEKPKGIGDCTHGRTDGIRPRERDQVHGLAGTMFVCAGPAARNETGAQDRQANPDPPANGKAPRTWCVCQWPNEVHAGALAPARGECAHRRAFKVHAHCSSRHTDNGDDDDTGHIDGGRARELHRDGNAVPAGSSECTGCEGAWPSAVPVRLRSLRDDALPDAVQAAAAWAAATKAAAVALPAMWPGAAMRKDIACISKPIDCLIASANAGEAPRGRHWSHWGSNHPALTEVSYDRD
jgi:hypothetical protein